MSLFEHYAVSQIRVGWKTTLEIVDQDRNPYDPFNNPASANVYLPNGKVLEDIKGKSIPWKGKRGKIDFQMGAGSIRHWDIGTEISVLFYVDAISQHKELNAMTLNMDGDNVTRYDNGEISKRLAKARRSLARSLTSMGFKPSPENFFEELYSSSEHA